MRWTIAALLVAALAGCGTTAKRLAVSRDGRAVIRDAYDGRLDRDWSCGSLRAAYRRLPVDLTYSTIPKLIGDAAAKECDSALAALHDGDRDQKVSAALGAPDEAPRCWLYRWPPGTGSADGARICFAAGRVTRVQTAVHG